MADLPEFVSAYRDRHDRTRYRYRERGKPPRSLPGDPGEARFEAALALARAGAPKHPRKPAAAPRTLRAAWLEVQKTVEWSVLKPGTRTQQSHVAERFFAMPIALGATITFGQMPFNGLRRGDIKKILARFTDRPHAGEVVLRLIRKLALTALDLEWIELDPTHRLRFRPKLIGHRAWTDDEMAAFEARWQPGSRQRLGYALALYTGQRRADVAAMRWTSYNGQGIAVTQEKGGVAPLWIPVHPKLRSILDATPPSDHTILTTAYGKPFTTFGFGNMMADAIGAAGLPDACRLHGLRKSAGRCLAEAGATTRQIMAVLGHKTLSEAERYTREAEQRMLAQQGMDQWSKPRLAVVK